jgi:hypothetical protein
MQREIVKFDVGAPQIVRLDFSEGKEVTSKSGAAQWQYTLDRDQRIMWLPLAGRQAIERSGARAGDEVRIVKSFLNRETVWTAQVIADEPAPLAIAPAALPPLASAPGNGNGYANNGYGRSIPPRAYYQAEARPAPGAPQPSQAEPARTVTTTTTPSASHTPDPAEQHLKHFLVMAGRATEDARRILIEEGYPAPEYFWDDIRAAAISLLINANGGRK